ncbi:hypothetical protein Drorol1_Dr00022166, partial [Drosera rotundifolia]
IFDVDSGFDIRTLSKRATNLMMDSLERRFQQECNVCKQSQIIGATSMIKKFRFMSVLKLGCCRWQSISQILLQMQPWTLCDQSIKLHNSRASVLLSPPPLSALQTEGELQPT